MKDEHWFELAKGQFRFSDNPTEEQINAKVQELKDAEVARNNARTSAINKLKGATYSALTDAEAKALFGE